MLFRYLFASTLIFIGLMGYFFGSFLRPVSANEPHIQVISINGYIDPVSTRYLSRSLAEAERNNANLVLINLNTPGGLLSSTRKITSNLINSSIPIVVYVSPNGARASSAGTFILASSHIAAMAPGTHLGAASPVGLKSEELPTTVEKKALEDTAAYIRSLAQERNRNVQLYESTVTNAKSFTSNESLENNLIDFIADDINKLMNKIDGITVETSSGKITLKTHNVILNQIDMNIFELFLSLIADPNIAFMLISIGTLAILIEFLIPGLIFPGVLGSIFLVLGFFAIGNLPFNWAGIVLIVFAIVLFIFEIQVPGIGVFGICGIISFAFGGSFLFTNFNPSLQSTNYSVDLWVILISVGILSIILGWFYHLFLSSRRSLNQFKEPSVIGLTGTAISDLSPNGSVFVGNENWRATVDNKGTIIKAGDTVIVVSLAGITIRVRKEDPKE